MSRSLRSNSRWKKLQVQHIKQVDKALRTNISNCTETKIDSFEQREFLSLFELLPIKQQQQQHVTKEQSQWAEVGPARNTRSLKRSILAHQNDDSNNNRFDTQSKRTIRLETYITDEERVQATLLTQRKILLNDMRNAIADKRKFDIFYEQDMQKNIILKIMIEEFHRKMIFLCK